MKNSMLIIAMLMTCFISKAQYSMTTGMENYQALDNPTSLNQGSVWDEGSTYQVYFNFDFEIYGQTFTALNVFAGGGISFPGLGNKELFVYHTPFGGYMLKDRGGTSSASDINYQIEGQAGDRVLKIEWKNAGFAQWYNTSSLTDYVDLQIWLFENDNHIEIHFGDNQASPGTYGYPDATSDPNPGPSVKFWFDSCNNVLCPTRAANLPSYDYYSLCNPNYYFIDGTPSIGVVYNIFPSEVSGVQSFDTEEIAIYPNPFSEQLSITFNEEQVNTEIKLLDVNGKVIRASSFSGIEYTMDRGKLNEGIYFLQISNGESSLTKKVVIH